VSLGKLFFKWWDLTKQCDRLEVLVFQGGKEIGAFGMECTRRPERISGVIQIAYWWSAHKVEPGRFIFSLG
jgi:hypothetical protein